jgi:Uma2 family endonuclease
MVRVARTAAGRDLQGDRWSLEDLERFPLPRGTRTEIVDGNLFVSPPPTVGHQIAVERIRGWIQAGLPAGRVVAHNLGVGTSRDFLVPDLLVGDLSTLPSGTALVPPDMVSLVVEVHSPSSVNHDLVTKVRKYAEFGIGRYWAVDTSEGTLTDLWLQEPIRPTVTYAQEEAALTLGGWSCRLALAELIPGA